jgi:hypothetical protein
MRRPAYYNQEWRLDQILKRKAEEGVKIYVIVYREVEVRYTIPDSYTITNNQSGSFDMQLCAHKTRSSSLVSQG